MRRLTLILSDLHLPEDAAREMAAAAGSMRDLAMPNLEWLMRFAHAREHTSDWRHWLAANLGYAPSDILAPAPFAARGLVSDCRAAWFATPAHLSARIDHVRLDARGVLCLGRDERLAWCAAFARTFGPQYALHDDSVGGFFLSGLAAAADAAITVDPARLLGADVGASLPRGAGAGELRRLGAEIEMWLHGAALNEARSRAGALPATALWLWGGGAMRAVSPPAARVATYFFGDDPFVAALARDMGAAVHAPPRMARDSADLEPTPERVIVVLPVFGERRTTLHQVDGDWIGYARESIEGGELAEVDLVVNDMHWRIAAHPQWRIWRRRRGWIEQLMRPGGDVKA